MPQNSNVDDTKIDFDLPLQPDIALEKDQLSREGFASIAASALRKVSSSVGFVLSIEGPWGSGKSSTLAMIQALLLRDAEATRPVIVHFNPWLIGDKDALLRQFLSSISKSIKLSDHSRDGKKVAKELKAYSKVFDLVKLVPGAEPWASMIKSVIEAAGDAAGAVSEYKTPDIEAYKQKVEVALRAFNRPVIVFIDDIDRLFPSEVFEMIRIIKAVGELPQIGYVVAWDSEYVSKALQNLNVPHAGSYLDKIVQVRMPLPNLSLSARGRLFNNALESLDAEVFGKYFEAQDKRLSFLYYSGLRELLGQPRDIARVFNSVRLMEPLLRGEIVFSDILGLAALSVRAPAVFDLLKRSPQLFVGRLSSNGFEIGDSDDLIKGGTEERKRAYSSCPGAAVTKIVHFLFPDVASAEDGHSLGRGEYADGVISHPSRLIIALQLSLTDDDVSIKAARHYLQDSGHRERIISQLTIDNCYEFVEMLGEVGASLPSGEVDHLESTCLSIARLVDTSLFVKRAKSRHVIFSAGIEDLALKAISQIIGAARAGNFTSILEGIVMEPYALTCAAEIFRRSYLDSHKCHGDSFNLNDNLKDSLVTAFARNVIESGSRRELLHQNCPGFIMWTLARLAPKQCGFLFNTLKRNDRSLDRFALEFLSKSWDSTKGIAYGLPTEEAVTSAYCSLDHLKKHAQSRLSDPSLVYPARAAWRSVVEGKVLYGVDGSEATR
ncbi:KAP family P-loop domain protein [Pseudomonas asplenii]|uniref:KAP family P-loop domain protein n=1 Tax=Pseudomonas asplenii TaxID=53407 RepID=A0A0M9GCI8_9PSED|nr:P-loop NTPase fold protein [Pseudomonas fuscovaginae]KPA87698.1 KAP family P-loop domain protein [Pseudomonas fuscovaginae]